MALGDSVVSDIVAGYYGSVMMNAYYYMYLSHLEPDSKKTCCVLYQAFLGGPVWRRRLCTGDFSE